MRAGPEALHRFLGDRLDYDLEVGVGHLAQVLEVVRQFVHAHTRGRGFTEGVPNDELAAVILTASARLASNPDQRRAEQHTQNEGPSTNVQYVGFSSFTLAETMVLNRYRKRAA